MEVKEYVNSLIAITSNYVIDDIAMLIIKYILPESLITGKYTDDYETLDYYIGLYGLDELLTCISKMKFAVLGAAEGKNNNLVRNLCKIYTYPDAVAEGACRSNNKELLTDEHRIYVDDKLVGACYGEHKDIIDEMLQLGASPNNGLYGAAMSNNVELAKHMIGLGAQHGLSFYAACTRDNLDVMKLLVNTYQITEEDLPRCLLLAHRLKHKEMEEYILRRFPELLDDLPMMAACEYEERALDLLRKKECKYNDVMYYACKNKEEKLIEKLTVGDFDVCDAFEGACSGNHTDLALRFLNYAIVKDTNQTLRFLKPTILKNISVRNIYNYGNDILIEAIKPLLAEIEPCSKHPLIIEAIRGCLYRRDTGAAKQLLREFPNVREFEAPINVCDDIELITLLMERNIDPKYFIPRMHKKEALDLICDNKKYGPTYVAMYAMNEYNLYTYDVLDYAIRKGADLNALLRDAIYTSSYKQIEYLLERGANPYFLLGKISNLDIDPNHLLLFARSSECKGMVERGANPNLALIRATAFDTDLVQWLVERGANFNANIPIGLAMISHSAYNRIDIITKMIDDGIDTRLFLRFDGLLSFLLEKNLVSPDYVLLAAIQITDKKLADLAIKRGANINITSFSSVREKVASIIDAET